MALSRSGLLTLPVGGAMLAAFVHCSNAATYQVIYNLNPPMGPINNVLAADPSGRLYGTYQYEDSAGTLIVLSPPAAGNSAWTASTPFKFGTGSGAGGIFPAGGVTLDKTAILGTAQSSGVSGGGTMFRLDRPHPVQETVLHAFPSNKPAHDGSTPQSGVVRGLSGLYYGTTEGGGYGPHGGLSDGRGTIYSVSDSTTSPKYAVLHRFGEGIDGVNPGTARLWVDPQGRLFGTTQTGGSNNTGTVFMAQSTKGRWSEQVIYNFPVAGAGFVNPHDAVVLDSSGNVYGCASGGLPPAQGGVYRLTPPSVVGGSWTETTLYNFGAQSGDPAVPPGSYGCGLTIDPSSNHLFGTSSGGGTGNFGTIFEMIPPANGGVAWTEQVDHSFLDTAEDGAYPIAPLLKVGNSYFGGNALGAVFEYTP